MALNEQEVARRARRHRLWLIKTAFGKPKYMLDADPGDGTVVCVFGDQGDGPSATLERIEEYLRSETTGDLHEILRQRRRLPDDESALVVFFPEGTTLDQINEYQRAHRAPS